MTLEELKIQSLQSQLVELDVFVSENRNEIKLLFSKLIADPSTTQVCVELIRHIHSNRKHGIEADGIQFLITNIAFYFKSANKPEFVQTCITNLKDTILKHRLQAWFQYKFEYRRTQSHINRFPQYLEKLSKAIVDENEDYTNDVLLDLHSYYSEFGHIAGFQELFDQDQLLNNHSILREYKERKHILDYIVSEHPNVDKIFTPSMFTERLFNEKFIDYIKEHKSTVWNNILLGINYNIIRSEIINFGQADFDKPYKNLPPRDIVKLYCYLNMRMHYYSSLYLFERCVWINELILKEGCLKFIDIGCGPATSGIALTDYLLNSDISKQQFDYIGVDFYESMLEAASDLMDNSIYSACTDIKFIKNLIEIQDEDFSNANSLIFNTCYLFASPSLDINSLSNEINELLRKHNGIPKFLLFQNTPNAEKNIKYQLFKQKILEHDILLSEKLPIKYNNQRNSYYTPVNESVFFEVLKFKDYV